MYKIHTMYIYKQFKTIIEAYYLYKLAFTDHMTG